MGQDEVEGWRDGKEPLGEARRGTWVQFRLGLHRRGKRQYHRTLSSNADAQRGSFELLLFIVICSRRPARLGGCNAVPKCPRSVASISLSPPLPLPSIWLCSIPSSYAAIAHSTVHRRPWTWSAQLLHTAASLDNASADSTIRGTGSTSLAVKSPETVLQCSCLGSGGGQEVALCRRAPVAAKCSQDPSPSSLSMGGSCMNLVDSRHPSPYSIKCPTCERILGGD